MGAGAGGSCARVRWRWLGCVRVGWFDVRRGSGRLRLFDGVRGIPALATRPRAGRRLQLLRQLDLRGELARFWTLRTPASEPHASCRCETAWESGARRSSPSAPRRWRGATRRSAPCLLRSMRSRQGHLRLLDVSRGEGRWHDTAWTRACECSIKFALFTSLYSAPVIQLPLKLTLGFWMIPAHYRAAIRSNPGDRDAQSHAQRSCWAARWRARQQMRISWFIPGSDSITCSSRTCLPVGGGAGGCERATEERGEHAAVSRLRSPRARYVTAQRTKVVLLVNLVIGPLNAPRLTDRGGQITRLVHRDAALVHLLRRLPLAVVREPEDLCGRAWVVEKG